MAFLNQKHHNEMNFNSNFLNILKDFYLQEHVCCIKQSVYFKAMILGPHRSTVTLAPSQTFSFIWFEMRLSLGLYLSSLGILMDSQILQHYA
jgi:hypothetical protein